MKLAVHYLKDYIYNLLKLVLIVKEFHCIKYIKSNTFKLNTITSI